MSRKTELATIFRELKALHTRARLVGSAELLNALGQAMDEVYGKYRQEVEAIARRAAEAA